MSDNYDDVPLLERLPSISQNERNRDQLRVTYAADKDVYVLPKAPVLEVYNVTDDANTEYTRGTDYQILTNTDGLPNEIDWGIGGDTPDVGSDFIVDQSFETIISRYAQAHDEEFDFYDHEIEDAIQGRHVDHASGQELDEIGKLFGALGRRAGRDDQDYKIYLKSIVKSFNGRGTVPGLRFAVASSLGASVESVQIVEDFENLEYDIIINNWPPHTGSNIEALADLADPSVVTLGLIRYQFEDEMAVGDAIDVIVNEIVEEAMAADDATQIDPNLITLADAAASDDAVFLDQNLTTTADEMAADDATNSDSRDINTARWEEQTHTHEVAWDFFEWTELIDLSRALSEELSVDDGATVQPKAATTSDTVGSNDTTSVQPKAAVTSDTVGSNDAAALQAKAAVIAEVAAVDDTGGVTANSTTVAEGSAVSDAETVVQTTVAWDLGNWETMEWSRAHN